MYNLYSGYDEVIDYFVAQLVEPRHVNPEVAIFLCLSKFI